MLHMETLISGLWEGSSNRSSPETQAPGTYDNPG